MPIGGQFCAPIDTAAIRSRREAERDLFAKGIYPTGTIPVWSVDRNGKVDFSRPIRRLIDSEALALLRPTGTQIQPPAQPATTPSWWQRLANLITGKETT
jgi:lysozyme